MGYNSGLKGLKLTLEVANVRELHKKLSYRHGGRYVVPTKKGLPERKLNTRVQKD
jgi:hypothetical protein